MKIIKNISDFIINTEFENIPDTALLQAKNSLLDWLFVAMAGVSYRYEPIEKFKQIRLSRTNSHESFIFGSKDKGTSNQAAIINGCVGHLLDFDETCPNIRSHLFATIVPSILALAEPRKKSGKDFLTALIIGHETALRIGEMMTPEWMNEGWHGTAIFGLFGSAAACSKLISLNIEQIISTLSITASMPSGIEENFGSLTKPLHAGMASERGLLAAQLGYCNFTSKESAFEGDFGFFHTYNWGQKIHKELFSKLGNPIELSFPGTSSIKLFPCCHGLTTNIEYGIKLHDKYHLQLSDIDSIEIHSQPKTLSAMLSHKYCQTGENIEWGYEGPPKRIVTKLPQTGLEAKFSKEYAFARALKDGEMKLEYLTDEAVKNKEILEWMKKIKLYHNSDMEKISNSYPENTGPHAEKMIIKLKNGNIIEEEEHFILGMAKRPLTFEHIKSKCYTLGDKIGLKDDSIADIIDKINNLEKIKDINEVIKHLR